LQQVLLNLVMNGIEAMNEVAEAERKISIRARRREHNGRPAVLVSVQDSGVGLKPAEVDRLFEAFYTTKAHGIGMGLAISRSIVEAHGGRLWVAPAGGRGGATFEFILPVARSEQTIVAVQKELEKLGYSHGQIDGIAGPETRKAINWFQSIDKLSVSGRIDNPTLKALQIS
jgi:Histidine kinase-, DNA gyrase B-, and HSP90-like ATPase/Putative peptidoglycan binding domain